MVDRDQHLGVAEANDSVRRDLADHGEAEHFLIEIDIAVRLMAMLVAETADLT
jgi:hypothetical protein